MRPPFSINGSHRPHEQCLTMANSIHKLREEKFFPKEQLTLEPFERDHALVAAVYLQKEFAGWSG